MRSKVSLLLSLAAWLLATGSHWDLVQTFAWGRMIALYSQSMPLQEAIRLTFTPENMCGVCEVVADAQQDANAATAPLTARDAKILLAPGDFPSVVLAAPQPERWPTFGVTTPDGFLTPPPLPPPRLA